MINFQFLGDFQKSHARRKTDPSFPFEDFRPVDNLQNHHAFKEQWIWAKQQNKTRRQIQGHTCITQQQQDLWLSSL